MRAIPTVTATNALGKSFILLRAGTLSQIKSTTMDTIVMMIAPRCIAPNLSVKYAILIPESNKCWVNLLLSENPKALGICFKMMIIPIPANIPSITLFGK